MHVQESSLLVSKVLNCLIPLVLKIIFEMQQVPLHFAVCFKYSLKYIDLHVFFFKFLSPCFYPNYDQYDYLIYFKIYSSSAIFPL